MSTVRRPCPQCDRGSKDTALAITTDERGTVQYCHRCGYTSAENFEYRPLVEVRPKSITQDWSDKAEAIWRRTVPLKGTVGETYLRHRRCVIPPSDGDARFLAGQGEYPPTMVARITDATTARPISLHFTQLAADGSSRLERRLLADHRKKGGVIRLWPDESVTRGLAIAEGIESALTAAWIFTPAWSLIDAGNMDTFPLLTGIEGLTIFADHDDAGMKAAQGCGRRWRDAGREVRIRAAATGDANDLVRGAI